MKQLPLIILLALLITACTRPTDPRPTEPTTSFANAYLGTWRFIAKQSAGIGPPGVWSNVPAGMTMTLDSNSQINGNAFTDVSSYQIVDSNTVKLIAPSQTEGFYLFDYRIDTVQKALFFYIRPPDGVTFCIEGCGAYRFER